MLGCIGAGGGDCACLLCSMGCKMALWYLDVCRQVDSATIASSREWLEFSKSSSSMLPQDMISVLLGTRISGIYRAGTVTDCC